MKVAIVSALLASFAFLAGIAALCLLVRTFVELM